MGPPLGARAGPLFWQAGMPAKKYRHRSRSC